ncbi:MAG: hypothetical protein ACRD12_23145, partial [Acidimicrobiales bacterium]
MIDLFDAGKLAVEYPVFRPTPIEEIRRRAQRRRRRRRAVVGGLTGAVTLLAIVAIVPMVGRDSARPLPVATSPGSTLAGRPATTVVTPTTAAPDAPPVTDSDGSPVTTTATTVASGPSTTVAQPAATAPPPDPEPSPPPSGNPTTTAIPVDSCTRSSLVATASTGQASYAPGATVSIQGSAHNRGTGPCILKGGGPPLTWTIRNAAGQEVVQLAHAAMIWADRAVQPGESVPL